MEAQKSVGNSGCTVSTTEPFRWRCSALRTGTRTDEFELTRGGTHPSADNATLDFFILTPAPDLRAQRVAALSR